MKKLKFSLSNAEVLTRDQQRSINGGSGGACTTNADCTGGGHCVNGVCGGEQALCSCSNGVDFWIPSCDQEPGDGRACYNYCASSFICSGPLT